jgi:hypothetical protein
LPDKDREGKPIIFDSYGMSPMVSFNPVIKDLMKTYVQYSPRKLQGGGYSGPITLLQYQRFQYIRDTLAKEGISIPLPTGN